ncbi:Family 31 glycosyl hydrolase [Pleurostoma richardsiae]|uniref:alpha-glucosidase n=1 Tax=Pleurostoma richardsiae TaxID=41990 RepID=A0AA38R2C0_9PEZI|nr:Family 31 glycosyl hydrolase [Pleurostoma richardsiae]
MLHQYERVPNRYMPDDEGATRSKPLPGIKLHSVDENLPHSFDFSFDAIRHNVFRTTFSSKSHPIPPFPSIRPPQPVFVGSSEPIVVTDLAACTSTIDCGSTRAVVEWSNAPVISLFLNGVQKAIHRDLHFRSYAVDDLGVAHYSVYKKDTLHVGLGEKAAPMNLSGRGFIISASDTFGYDAYRTDPLYKHIPLLINVTPQGCVGIFSASHSRGTWAVGSEIDGMWGHFKVYRQAYGGLEEYLILGKTVDEVVRSYADLAGYPLLVPRYMMGYVSGGMKYSMEDEPRAADAIVGFIEKCREHDIPVSAFQMSSGYTVAETEPKTRNVFTWNHHRFPDPRAFTKECHKRGVRLLANIKPYVLANHPAYGQLSASGAFFKDPITQATAVARLWSAGGGESGEGSHIDFTSKAGFTWWYEGCRALKEVGIDAMWNDNNEYNIPSDDWQCALETVPVPEGETGKHIGLWGRAMHTELMGKGSHDACVDAEPDARPLVLTRSATAGTMRYAACSWSGDNVTSWEGMKGSNALALNAGFSLLQCYGHDIGGFEGPQPTPEHLVRWIQLGIHSPRFAINCYKTSPEDNLVGDVIEPWMYPSVTPLVRAAIKRRYELVPYTYSLCLQSHVSAVPPQRWTGWGYEEDKNVWTKEIMAGDTQYWFGDALLISGVYEPGRSTARVYLPCGNGNHGFLNTNAPYQHLAAGQWHEVSSTWHSSIPVLARCGSAVPVGKNRPTSCRAEEDPEFPGEEKDDWRGVEIFPPPVHAILASAPVVAHNDGANEVELRGPAADSATTQQLFRSTWMEDDGISSESLAEMCVLQVAYEPTEKSIVLEVQATKQGAWAPLWLTNGVDIILPVGEERRVVLTDGKAAADQGRDLKGRRVWKVDVSLGQCLAVLDRPGDGK